jgi:hypothetical protein
VSERKEKHLRSQYRDAVTSKAQKELTMKFIETLHILQNDLDLMRGRRYEIYDTLRLFVLTYCITIAMVF